MADDTTPLMFSVTFDVEEDDQPVTERVEVTADDVDGASVDDPEQVAVVTAADKTGLTHAETREIEQL